MRIPTKKWCKKLIICKSGDDVAFAVDTGISLVLRPIRQRKDSYITRCCVAFHARRFAFFSKDSLMLLYQLPTADLFVSYANLFALKTAAQ